MRPHHARNLRARRRKQPRELSRRRLQKSDQLAAQLIQRRKRGQHRDFGGAERLALDDCGAQLTVLNWSPTPKEITLACANGHRYRIATGDADALTLEAF